MPDLLEIPTADAHSASVPARTIAETPAGRVRITTLAGAVRAIAFLDEQAELPAPEEPCALPPSPADIDLSHRAANQLEAYTRGERAGFDLPLAPRGADFQRRVWQLLLDVPQGATTTYSALADSLGSPTLTRAVGGAVGANPIAIVVPCHRVIGKDGSLTGYAGGLARKKALLAHEGAGAPLFA